MNGRRLTASSEPLYFKTCIVIRIHVLILVYNYRSMDNSGSSIRVWFFRIITVIFLILGLVTIYYLYQFLYGPDTDKRTTLLSGKQAADVSPTKLPTIPVPYEGGEYSVNTWVYISSFNKNMNSRKHIFELQGNIFSTLLIGLGAFNNTLVVRTHTQSAEGFADWTTVTGGTGAGSAMTGSVMTGSRTAGPSLLIAPVNAANTIANRLSAPVNSQVTFAPSNSQGNGANLSAASLNSMFTPLAMNDSLLDTPPICDLPEIDLQRWTMVTVVLSGRTIDVYIDGKLRRSCVTPSYYKVDPTGVKAVMTSRGGFDGYTGNTSVANYSMNPDEIYRAYLAGPEGSSTPGDILNWFVSLFKGSS